LRRRVIITHQDFDHIGGANAVVAASGAEVLAHGDDVPFMRGERRLLKLEPGRIEAMVQALPAEQRERVPVLLHIRHRSGQTGPSSMVKRCPIAVGSS